MDDGRPSGPKTKWWSRPSTDRPGQAGPEDAAAVAGTPRSATGHDATAPTPPERSAPGAAEPEDYTPAPPLSPADRAGHASVPSAEDRAEDHTPAPLSGARVAQGTAAPDPEGYGPTPPAAHRAPAAQAPVPAPEGRTSEPPLAQPPVEPPAPGPFAPAARAQPLHAPDEYSTPPYGGPGPWAPAPPVQRPVPTPAHGTPVPPPYAGNAAHGTAAAAPGPAEGYAPPPPPSTVPQQPGAPQPPQGPPTSQWMRYDPWGAPQQPLSHPGPVADTRRPRGGRRGSLLVGAALLALVAGGIGGGIGAYVERNGGLTTVELQQADRDNGGRAPDSVAGIAASALPSVVTLHVNGSAESGTGTGFVLDDKGHILTNNHVVAPAGSTGDITVTFSGGETAPAEIVGKDSGYDLAVVKVSGVSGLKPLPLGNSDNVQVGDPVVAIGAPFDLSNTVTSGIISAKQRPITAGGEKGDGTDVSYVDALQTDAPINPGNSGGPLVDTEARVIGINSAIRAADSAAGAEGGQSGSIGLGFAIPINQGKRVAEELINTGKATHPVIGVTLDMEFAGDGAKVGGKADNGGPAVTEAGPADKAGIRAGDVITEVEGQRVHSGEELIVKIRAHRPGDELGLRLKRGGKDLSMTLTLGSASGT
ncbi:trypsin-like peptidase domain-containing protein [Streptomyces sp. NBC_01341]|uniref:trypsin-like peptidase domain-containing protein n=1 Tax=Streptomyces sp. NBC_01341 TaxID=2903831 RepID=UPI002E1584BF|nr:trypsin-like peptidase domain-containing protein [Streptomyces sp. NBC_01341]